MKLSKFGQKFTAKTGILELMDDLGKALGEIANNPDAKVNMLGGGNPAHIPGLQNKLRERMQEILESGGEYENMISNYDGSGGNPEFINSFVKFINNKYDWGIDAENIMVTSGSQSGFFILFNLLAGEFADGKKKKILLPIIPEYIGYADQGLSEDFFHGLEPEIEILSDHTFKYKINFDLLEKTLEEESENFGLISLSRPTNPTGNVVTDEELDKLSKLAEKYNIPLSVDNAYGEPFPNVIYEDVKLNWNENTILSFSLSKIGLPSSRTGIFIANKGTVRAMAKVNAILSLATGSYGQHIMKSYLESGEIETMAKDIVYPYYKEKQEYAIKKITETFDDSLEYYVHKSEGAFFLWFWFKDFPITTKELYSRLKEKETIIVPGEYFFPGNQDKNWKHATECIRINYARPAHEIDEGLRIIAEEVKKAYAVLAP